MMADIEKVIKELEILRDICNAKSNMAVGKGKIAWAGYANAADDAIAMLKEQEAVKPKKTAYQRVDHTIAYRYRCGTCDMCIFPSYKYCPFCGQAVKWE